MDSALIFITIYYFHQIIFDTDLSKSCIVHFCSFITCSTQAKAFLSPSLQFEQNHNWLRLLPAFALIISDKCIYQVSSQYEKEIKMESIRKLKNFNFQKTKTLYQNNLNNTAFLFTFFKGYRYNLLSVITPKTISLGSPIKYMSNFRRIVKTKVKF